LLESCGECKGANILPARNRIHSGIENALWQFYVPPIAI
jgi:hypothetical protein